MSTDGGVLERPANDAKVDEITLPGGNGNGAGPPGPVQGQGRSRPPSPDGEGLRALAVLLLSVVLSVALGGALAAADVPGWSYLFLLVASGGGVYFLWKPKSVRLKRLAVALVVAVGSTTVGVAGTKAWQNWVCSSAVGRALEPAATEAFKTAYSRGGRGRFGCPKADALVRKGGFFQKFSGGRAGIGVIAGEPGETPVPLFGSLWRYYEGIGRGGLRSAASRAGIPSESSRDGTARVVYLTNGECGQGALYRPQRGSAYWVWGEIYEKYVSRGAHHGKLGFPVSDPVFNGHRLKQKFEGGVVRVNASAFGACYSAA